LYLSRREAPENCFLKISRKNNFSSGGHLWEAKEYSQRSRAPQKAFLPSELSDTRQNKFKELSEVKELYEKVDQLMFPFKIFVHMSPKSGSDLSKFCIWL